LEPTKFANLCDLNSESYEISSPKYLKTEETETSGKEKDLIFPTEIDIKRKVTSKSIERKKKKPDSFYKITSKDIEEILLKEEGKDGIFHFS
jgi:hypothetical protein